MFDTKIKAFDTFVIIARTSSSITLSVTGIGLLVIPISTATACRLSIGKKILHEIVMQKYKKYKKQYGKDQKQLKPLIIHIGKVYKIVQLIKMNKNPIYYFY